MITLIDGLPGDGKSYYATKITVQGIKNGRPVYSNFPISFIYDGNYYETMLLEENMIADASYMDNAILIIDECQDWFHSRDIKRFTREKRKTFNAHRHLGVDIYLLTQHILMVDTNLRRLVGNYIQVRRTMKLFGLVVFKTVQWGSYLAYEQLYDKVPMIKMAKQQSGEKFQMTDVFPLYKKNFSRLKSKIAFCYDTHYEKRNFSGRIVSKEKWSDHHDINFYDHKSKSYYGVDGQFIRHRDERSLSGMILSKIRRKLNDRKQAKLQSKNVVNVVDDIDHDNSN